VKAVGGILLFLFAVAVLGFVAFVWQTAADEQPKHPLPTVLTTPPSTVLPAP
jgi:hypothetical protein